MKLVTSWDDGYAEDFRIAELLRKHRLPGIFYIAGTTELTEREIEELAREFVIGGHTVHHPEDMKRLDPQTQYLEIFDNRRMLSAIAHQDVTSFAYPSGRYNEITIECVKRAGFTEARTTYSGATTMPEDPYRIRPTIMAQPGKETIGRSDVESGASWLDTAKHMLEESRWAGDNGYFHLWGHARDIEEHNLWDELDEIFGCMAELAWANVPQNQ